MLRRCRLIHLLLNHLYQSSNQFTRHHLSIIVHPLVTRPLVHPPPT
jgi:hypothetical protein